MSCPLWRSPKPTESTAPPTKAPASIRTCRGSEIVVPTITNSRAAVYQRQMSAP